MGPPTLDVAEQVSIHALVLVLGHANRSGARWRHLRETDGCERIWWGPVSRIASSFQLKRRSIQTLAARQPALRASASLQNHRSPLATLILVLP